MDENQNQTYCSLDIETSGFDPLKDEILEVGFVFFEAGKKDFKIIKEWTQVFKPSKEASPNILALTGITQEELEGAPKFSEHREFLQKELGKAIIVGHNIEFDIRFLESFGIKISGKSIDTLQLAQFILPTRHSYNLENLMHFFSILHKEAHRALADCRATLKLLEKLLSVYQGFPSKLKQDIFKLAEGQGFYWKDLLEINFSPLKKSITSKEPVALALKLDLKPNQLYDLPFNEDYLTGALRALQNKRQKFFVSLPKIWQVYRLWKEGLCQPFFSEKVLFDEKKFQKLTRKDDISQQEALFILKIMVWKTVNWQSETILDLNLSFFGGQFRDLVTGGRNKDFTEAKVICIDHETFNSRTDVKLFKDRFLLIVGLNEFEQQISSNISTKVSWGYLTYAFYSIYSPETGAGNVNLKEQVLEALTATDLFFGVVGILLGKNQLFQYVKVDLELEASHQYSKIIKAAENYGDKLRVLNESLKSDAISLAVGALERFFTPEENRVKWVEISENRCVLNNSPIKIDSLVKKILLPFGKISVMDSLNSKILTDYFKKRLGLEQLKTQTVQTFSDSDKKDLLSFIRTDSTKGKICKFIEAVAVEKDFLEILSEDAFPAVLLLSNLTQAREFYTNNYLQLKEKASLMAQNFSGGSNKLLRNFAINKKSLLVATDKFILKFLKNKHNVDAVEHLSVKTLVLCRLPFEQFSHPYYEALAETFENPFMDFSLPLALNNLHMLIKFFSSKGLEKVYLYDLKLGKEYAKVFKEYLRNLSGFTIEAEN